MDQTKAKMYKLDS